MVDEPPALLPVTPAVRHINHYTFSKFPYIYGRLQGALYIFALTDVPTNIDKTKNDCGLLYWKVLSQLSLSYSN